MLKKLLDSIYLAISADATADDFDIDQIVNVPIDDPDYLRDKRRFLALTPEERFVPGLVHV